jgi:hypothetical protein
MPKILLDESVPRPVARAFPEGEATTVDRIGWKGIENGRLLLDAETHGFEVLITSDKNMRHQNGLTGRRLAVVVLPHTNWPKLRGMLDAIAAAAATARPGTFTMMVPTPPRTSARDQP